MEPDEPLRIETEGVTVTKRYEPEEFAVPTISFEIHSARETSTEIRIEERVPEEFPIEGIGFHPEYDSDRWTAYEDGRLVFESPIEPETTVVTVYGIRITDDEEWKPFMTDPELTVCEAGLTEIQSDGVAVVADGAGDAIPVPVTHAETVEPDSAMVPQNRTEGVAAALAEELRAGTVSAADRETLREALGATEPESETVQLRHLQARVSELEAYTDAFEGFLDEHGTGEQLVSELQGGLNDLRDGVEALDSEVAESATERQVAIDAMEEDLDSIDAAIGNPEDIAADIDAVSADLDALYEQVDELRTWREQMGVAFGNE